MTPPKSLPPAPAASNLAVRAVMRGNRGEDTAPERALRSELHRRGLRFRKHVAPQRGLRCRADVVFPRQKIAVFVDGCFWHGCPVHGRAPRKNSGYWSSKLRLNAERDARNDRVLGQAGWRVIRVWEHEDPVETAARIERLVASARATAVV
ncbi:MAG TPA: very short patch repair endonuclease [Solirubrobacterales bacterium]|nr:very short patch repair endonuclease [Solirubrobacterales bacterium]